MSRENFVKEYMAIRMATFKSTTVKSAWRKSGCWPINPDVFTEEDYAPSTPMSTAASHVPTSYPETAARCRACDRSAKDADIDASINIDDESLSIIDSSSDESEDKETYSPSTSQTITRAYSLPCLGPSQNGNHQVVTRARSHPHLGPWSGKHNLWSEVKRLEGGNESMQKQIAFLEAHLSMARSHIEDLEKRHYNQDKREQKKRKLNVDARCLTSDEGLQ